MRGDNGFRPSINRWHACLASARQACRVPVAGRSSMVEPRALDATRAIKLSGVGWVWRCLDGKKRPAAIPVVRRRSSVSVVHFVTALAVRCEAGLVHAPREATVGLVLAKIPVRDRFAIVSEAASAVGFWGKRPRCVAVPSVAREQCPTGDCHTGSCPGARRDCCARLLWRNPR